MIVKRHTFHLIFILAPYMHSIEHLFFVHFAHIKHIYFSNLFQFFAGTCKKNNQRMQDAYPLGIAYWRQIIRRFYVGYALLFYIIRHFSYLMTFIWISFLISIHARTSNHITRSKAKMHSCGDLVSNMWKKQSIKHTKIESTLRYHWVNGPNSNMSSVNINHVMETGK